MNCPKCEAGPFENESLLIAHWNDVCTGSPEGLQNRIDDFEAAYVEFRNQQLDAASHRVECSLHNEPENAARPCDCGAIQVVPS
ncbi:hypothetical protein HWC06_gp68 [Gordonia phage Duffington]|uniref:Uncharacterized protein n=1 Tax=Gordonia phage Duffington TaxID=2507858 RepID=A0A410TCN0_9CAUD|nr:hypothetical protein HWC06_gp68 [Gordonia phage Duffington]QAU06774.1 hypothetical protein SEA_DUFFINGTON_68 [Gordonia phage Duffington]